MQLLLGLKGSPLVGATILNFVTPESAGAAAGEVGRVAENSGVAKLSIPTPTSDA